MQHQSLLHFLGNAPWPGEPVLARVRELVLPSIKRESSIEAWIIDDTGFPKKGRHSVGVTRQYCGQLGKQDNCQVAVTLPIAKHCVSLPVGYSSICRRPGRRRRPADQGLRADIGRLPHQTQDRARPDLRRSCGRNSQGRRADGCGPWR
jgi:hypothetical protein